jgi:hypothetical protein
MANEIQLYRQISMKKQFKVHCTIFLTSLTYALKMALFAEWLGGYLAYVVLLRTTLLNEILFTSVCFKEYQCFVFQLSFITSFIFNLLRLYSWGTSFGYDILTTKCEEN